MVHFSHGKPAHKSPFLGIKNHRRNGHQLEPPSNPRRQIHALNIESDRTKASPSDRQSNGARATSEPTPKPCNRHQGATAKLFYFFIKFFYPFQTNKTLFL